MSQITPSAPSEPFSAVTEPGAEERDPSRRERKKQITRDALIQAAMDLFAAKGYEHTAIHEITDAVDVSERTFFRYFASKEDLVLSFVRDGMTAFAQALAARPPQEEPLAAARAAFQISLRELSGRADGDMPTYLSVLELIDSTPALLAAHLRYIHDHEEEIIGVLARREGVDPAADRRPRLLAAVIGAMVFLASHECRAEGEDGPEAVAAAFDAYADDLDSALAGHWAATPLAAQPLTQAPRSPVTMTWSPTVQEITAWLVYGTG